MNRLTLGLVVGILSFIACILVLPATFKEIAPKPGVEACTQTGTEIIASCEYIKKTTYFFALPKILTSTSLSGVNYIHNFNVGSKNEEPFGIVSINLVPAIVVAILATYGYYLWPNLNKQKS